MNKLRWLLMMVIALTLVCVIIGGCEPEAVIHQVDVQMTDPNSGLQLATDSAVKALQPLTILVSAIPGIPYAAAIKTGLAIAMSILALIQSWRKVKSDTALKEVVIGLNDAKKAPVLKKGSVGREAIRVASNQAQSPETRAKVTEIRKTIEVKK